MKTLKNLSKVFAILFGIVGTSSSCSKVGDCVNCRYTYDGEKYTSTYCIDEFEPSEEYPTWASYVKYLNEWFKYYYGKNASCK